MKKLSLAVGTCVGVFFLFVVSGCSFGRGFQAPPAWWTYFSGDGASEAKVRAALLECGSSIPGYYGDTDKFLMPNGKAFPRAGVNETVLVTECMKNSGFPYPERRPKSLCAGGGRDMYGNITPPKDIPACKPDAVIPIRSVENRLNSLYCKTYPRSKVCQADYDSSTDHESWRDQPTETELLPPIQSERSEELMRENLKALQRAQEATKINPYKPPAKPPVIPPAPNSRLEKLKGG